MVITVKNTHNPPSPAPMDRKWTESGPQMDQKHGHRMDTKTITDWTQNRHKTRRATYDTYHLPAVVWPFEIAQTVQVVVLVYPGKDRNSRTFQNLCRVTDCIWTDFGIYALFANNTCSRHGSPWQMFQITPDVRHSCRRQAAGLLLRHLPVHTLYLRRTPCQHTNPSTVHQQGS